MEGDLAIHVNAFLKGEEQNQSAEFEVRGVHLINAEVKLIKCKIDDMSVDISFNQLGGICKLCFLEQVDRLIGKGHLFKRSVILIKAWFYYESHLLGAHYGLMASYALETLVLYIFQFYHSSLSGPLAVLHKFLQYYSQFDWETYCISLSGPVHITCLPEIMVEKPENDGGSLLLSSETLRYFVDIFSVSQRVPETKSFQLKHLNIIDPLKENNNLGRSITEANSYRIRGAFSQGSRELNRILSLSIERIAVEICKYFSRLLRIHGSPDVKCCASSGLMSGNSSLNAEVGTSLGFHEIPLSLLDLTGDYETCFNSMLRARSYCNDAPPRPFLELCPPYPSQPFYNQSPLTLNSSLHSRQNVFPIPHVTANNIVLGSPRYPVNFPSVSGAAFSGEDRQPHRGLGTFFPRTNTQSYMDRPSRGQTNRVKTTVSSGSVAEQLYRIDDEDEFPPLPTHNR